MIDTIVSIAARLFKLLIISREGWEVGIPYGWTSRKWPLKMPTRIRPHNRRKICWDIVLNREDFKEQKNSTPLPCPLHSKLGFLLFSWGSSNSGTSLHGRDGEKKLHFPVLKSEKRQKSPLGRSYVATTNQRWREIEACFSNSIIHITLKAFQFIALSSRSSGIELGGGLEPTTGKTSPFARGLSVV